MIALRIVPAPISANGLYRIAARPFPRIYMTQDGKDLKEAYQWQLKTQWRQRPIKKGVELILYIYYPDKKRRDADNAMKIVFDALKQIVFEDDSQVMHYSVYKRVDKQNPRVDIDVQELAE